MTESFDTNLDGTSDAIRFDSNADGYNDAAAFDQDQNGIYEAMIADTDGTGDAEVSMHDTDQNGVFETMQVDTDNDGFVDVVAADLDQNGVLDVASGVANTDADVREAIVGGTVVGPATNRDPVTGLILDLAGETGDVAYGPGDRDHDQLNDDVDPRPDDPWHNY
jgi:hypothetical protein